MLQPDNSVENTSRTEVPNNLRPVFCSPDDRSYHIKTENDQVISRNRVHLRETNVKFVPQIQNIPRVSKF